MGYSEPGTRNFFETYFVNNSGVQGNVTLFMNRMLTEKFEIWWIKPSSFLILFCALWTARTKSKTSILKVCKLVMSALRTKMIYWSLRHVLLFSTLTQNHGCSAHNSDMQTSSASSICSVTRNTEHIMFPTLRARIGQYSMGWTEKKGRKWFSIACIYVEPSAMV